MQPARPCFTKSNTDLQQHQKRSPKQTKDNHQPHSDSVLWEFILPKDSLSMELPPICGINCINPESQCSGEEFHPVCNQLLGFYLHSFNQFITPFEFSSLSSSPAPSITQVFVYCTCMSGLLDHHFCTLGMMS